QKGEPVGISVTPQGFSRFGSTLPVGNAILVDQRRFVDDKIRWDITAGFDCRGRPEVRDEHSDQRGRQYRTAHSSLPSTSEMQSSDFRCGRMRKKGRYCGDWFHQFLRSGFT